MKYITAPLVEGEQAIQTKLETALQAGKRVLWFVSGGSNIPITVRILDALAGELTKNLSLTLIDERYGPVGHPDSNAQQLHAAGLNLKQATFIPVLDSSDQQTAAQHFAAQVEQALGTSDISIGQLGMGDDGHIAGVKPHTVAVNTQGLVTSYRGPDFERITLTLAALQKLTYIYLFAYGENKKAQLLKLRDEILPVDDQPAQFLKTLPEVYVYNDQLEEGNAA